MSAKKKQQQFIPAVKVYLQVIYDTIWFHSEIWAIYADTTMLSSKSNLTGLYLQKKNS